jgi:hypothetical protein
MMHELAYGLVRIWHIVPSGIQIALLICMSYTLIAINTCAIAKARYLPTFLTSTVFMVVNFALIQHVASAKTLNEFWGYLVGGVSGDLLGIAISKWWKIV